MALVAQTVPGFDGRSQPIGLGGRESLGDDSCDEDIDRESRIIGNDTVAGILVYGLLASLFRKAPKTASIVALVLWIVKRRVGSPSSGLIDDR